MPIANIGSVPDVVTATVIASDWGNAIGSASRGRVVQRFNTPAERDASITAPVAGMLCYVLSTNLFYGYRSPGGWVPILGGPKDTAHTRVYRAAAFTIAAEATLVFDTIDFDAMGSYSTGTGLYTCPAAGIYQVSGKTGFSAGAAGQAPDVRVYKSGALVCIAGGLYAPAAGGLHLAFAPVVQKCAAGDTLSLRTSCIASVAGLAGAIQTFASFDYLGTG